MFLVQEISYRAITAIFTLLPTSTRKGDGRPHTASLFIQLAAACAAETGEILVHDL